MLRIGGQTKFMTSRQGAVAGCVGDACGGGNISRQRVKIAAGGRKRKHKRTRRRQHRRKHRGGAYGVVKLDSTYGRGYPNIEFVDTCSQQNSPAKVHQTGGYSLMEASAYPNNLPYHGYTGGEDVRLFAGSYPPVTISERGSCGGGKNKKRRLRKKRTLRRKSKGKKRHTKRKTRTRRHKKTRRTRRHRGGYSNPNLPSSPGLVLPGESLPATRSAEATPSPAGRNNFNGTGKCVDNYNHYTGTSRKN